MAIAVVLAASAHAGVLVGPGSNWTHYKGRSSPPAQGSVAWKDPGYNDTGVFGSPRPEPYYYGYYTHYPGTELTDMLNGYLSVFLRQVFDVSDPSAIQRLTLVADYDDGFVAYLNGVEIARRNMPAGSITHSTAAPEGREASCGDATSDPLEPEYIHVDPALLVAGANTLAVSGHNASLGSSDFFISVQLNEGVNLTRGPFLQLPGTTGVTVAWSTDALVDGAVDWGSDPSCSDGTVEASALSLRHTAHLPVPHDGRDYFYRVRCGDRVLADGVALRAPRTASQRWRAVICGDWGTHATPNRALGLAVHGVNADLQLTVGDNNQNQGAPGDYDPTWFRPFAEVMRYAPVMPALGNHDWPARNGYWFQEYFTLPQNGPSEPAGMKEKNYSFDYGGVHFAVIDTEVFAKNMTAEMEATRDWLQADLAATQQRWKIVILHRPPYTSLGNHGPQAGVLSYICPVMEAAGVKIVFQGHNHFYERSQPINGIRYLTVGGTTCSTYPINERKVHSAFLKNDSTFLGRFEVDGPLFHFEMRSWDGAFIDQLYLNLADSFVMDGALDAVPVRSPAGGRLHAAIRGHQLYVATRDAAYGNDHFLYVSRQPGALRSANWAKVGGIAAWDAYLADESDNGYACWFNSSEAVIGDVVAFQAVTPGLPKNGTPNDGVLEGIVDMRALWGEIPETIHLAAAAYGNSNGGALIPSGQAPDGNGNGDIEADEYLALDARSLALDLPVAIASASCSVAEKGESITLDSSDSRNPSGLPLTRSWTQISGPTCIIDNHEAEHPVVQVTGNPEEAQTAVFQLTVNDTRFDSDPAVVEVTILPRTYENWAARHFTADEPEADRRPGADPDGDGLTNGQEWIFGGDPKVPNGRHPLGTAIAGDGTSGFTVSFSTIAGRVYEVQSTDSLDSAWDGVPGGTFPGDGTRKDFTDATSVGRGGRFYRVAVRLEP